MSDKSTGSVPMIEAADPPILSSTESITPSTSTESITPSTSIEPQSSTLGMKRKRKPNLVKRIEDIVFEQISDFTTNLNENKTKDIKEKIQEIGNLESENEALKRKINDLQNTLKNTNLNQKKIDELEKKKNQYFKEIVQKESEIDNLKEKINENKEKFLNDFLKNIKKKYNDEDKKYVYINNRNVFNNEGAFIESTLSSIENYEQVVRYILIVFLFYDIYLSQTNVQLKSKDENLEKNTNIINQYSITTEEDEIIILALAENPNKQLFYARLRLSKDIQETKDVNIKTSENIRNLEFLLSFLSNIKLNNQYIVKKQNKKIGRYISTKDGNYIIV